MAVAKPLGRSLFAAVLSASPLSCVVRANIFHGALIALGLCFAHLLPMTLQKKIGPRPSLELWRDFGLNRLLRLTIGHAVVLAFLAMQQADQNMWTVGRNCGNGCDAGKQQNAIGARVSNVGELLERATYFVYGPDKGSTQISSELIFHAGSNFFESHGPEFRDHAAGSKSVCQLVRRGMQNVFRVNANVCAQ